MSGMFASLPYAQGHGATERGLDGGIVYYALACMMRSRVSVCLGSGGGFVPCLMRQAQRDLGLEDSVTYLVDAIMPEAGFGGPEIGGGWRDPKGVFSQKYPEIVTLNCLTTEAGRGFFRKNEVRIEFLHVDANHSFEHALEDFETFLPLLTTGAVVTFHDTNTEDIQRVLAEVAVRHEFQCLDMPDLGAGIAVVRRKLAPTRMDN